MLLPFQGAVALASLTQGVALGYKLAAPSGRYFRNYFYETKISLADG